MRKTLILLGVSAYAFAAPVVKNRLAQATVRSLEGEDAEVAATTTVAAEDQTLYNSVGGGDDCDCNDDPDPCEPLQLCDCDLTGVVGTGGGTG